MVSIGQHCVHTSTVTLVTNNGSMSAARMGRGTSGLPALVVRKIAIDARTTLGTDL